MTEQAPTLTFQELDSILAIIDAAPRDGEVKITVGDVTLEIATRSSSPAAQPAAATAPATVAAATPEAAPPAPAVPAPAVAAPAPAAAASAAADGDDLGGLTAIPAPMTGVFYTRPNPSAEPFVAVGDTVVKGQDLAIVEVMKLMNRIGSPVDGIVRRICAESDSLVEHGSALFYIEAIGGAA
ncbi:acetyl-CoA carboxylase biotin carboxyl carrier protein [Arthrobacter sp. 35W]|uniref:acetyl-CoA carboxylase biotin carboxyl carrier protein n=1 Tax=Arthrobacter sp. 35W TaxID=1132441 RepID=UPI00041B6BAF|nr:biotin/lipoyl-containing protein [Arthrobacter sp. 35W]